MRHDKELKVCGHVTPHLEQLLADLREHGWHIATCAWPEDRSHCPYRPGRAHLITLDGLSVEQLHRVEALLAHSHAEWVFAVSENELADDHIRRMLATGAFAFHVLPGDAGSLEALLQHARAMANLRHELGDGAAQTRQNQAQAEHEMVGTGPAMHGLFAEIRKIASVDAPVLIRGESGSGKELAAEAIHERSARAGGPFVAVNCAALPPDLVQSELFGHEKGAFTGANARRIGHVESANGGTLLLDEIGDLPQPLQVHLLRFLQSGKIRRVGGSTEIAVDVRVLSATHVPLEQALRDGTFREDLYHRLNVVFLRIPPLRERPEDIEVLAHFFFQRFARDRPARMRGISQDALQRMCQHDWPGNVRELINCLRRAMVMGDGRLISVADLGLERRAEPVGEIVTLEQARERAEHVRIGAALGRNRHRVTHAARELGVSRVTLYRLMEKHGLSPRPPAEPGPKPTTEPVRA